MEKLLVSIYRAEHNESSYLYTEKKVGLKKTPKQLLNNFGNPIYVMDLTLTEQQENNLLLKDVLLEIREKGYLIHSTENSCQE